MRAELAQHRLRDHELADGVHQLVDLLDADADRAAVADVLNRGFAGAVRAARRDRSSRRGLPRRCRLDGLLARYRQLGAGFGAARAPTAATAGLTRLICRSQSPSAHSNTWSIWLSRSRRSSTAEVPGEIAGLRIQARERGQCLDVGIRLRDRRAQPARAACAADRCRCANSCGVRAGSEMRQRCACSARWPHRRHGCRCSRGRCRGAAALPPHGAAFFCAITSSRSNCRSATRCASIGCLCCTARSIARITSTDFSSRSDDRERHLHARRRAARRASSRGCA